MIEKIFEEVVAYLRYSDHKQDDGFSIEYQTREVNEYAENNGLTIDRYFIEKAQTATKVSGREEFFALIAAVKRGEVKTIIVYKLSRLFRNTLESSKYRKLFRDKNVKLISVTQAVDEDTSAGRFQTNIMASVDQYQSETISDHVKSSMREMARQGFYTGGIVRYGYDLKIVPNGSKMRKSYIPHEKEAPVVKKIFEMYVGGYSLGMIRNYLNDNNIPTKKGKPFTNSFIARVIEDEMYIGTYRYRTQGYDDVIAPNVIPPLIDKETFRKANEIKDTKTSNTPQPRRTERLYSLTGKIKCGMCGGHFTGFSIKKERGEVTEYLYYVCKNRKVYKRCENKFLSKDFVENAALNAITSLVLNDDKIDELSVMVSELCQQSPSELDEKIKLHTKQKAKIEKGITNILDVIADGEGDNDHAKKKLSALNKELKKTVKLLHALKDQRENLITPQSVKIYLLNMLEKATSHNEGEIKVIFDTFVDEITVTETDINIKLKVFPTENYSDLPPVSLDRNIHRV